MTHKFSELEAKMSPEARARVKEKVQAALAEMSLSMFHDEYEDCETLLTEAWEKGFKLVQEDNYASEASLP